MTLIGIAWIMRPGSRDRDPCEIEQERGEHDDQQADEGDRKRSRGRLAVPRQQAFYSRDELSSGRVLRDPASWIGERGRGARAFALAGGQEERRRLEWDLGLGRDQCGVQNDRVREPRPRGARGLGQRAEPPDLVAPLQAQQRFERAADNSMPGMTGLEVARMLRANLPETKIVFLTLDPGIKDLALATGAVAHISKDQPPQEILRVVRSAAGVAGIKNGPAATSVQAKLA